MHIADRIFIKINVYYYRNQRKAVRDMSKKEYREFLINGILEFQTKGNLTKETLQKYSIRTLEKIYDHIQ